MPESAGVVFVHGFPGFARIGDFAYFRDVETHLAARLPGVKTFVADVPAAGPPSDRARSLEAQIESRFSKPVYIIAHDHRARRGRIGRAVLSLAQRATPHRSRPFPLLTGGR